jgi:hypothetical protein
VQGEDFEVNLIRIDTNKKMIIDEAMLNPKFLVLKIDRRFKLDS